MAGAGTVQMGPNSVQNPGALVAALKASAPPSNSQTPLERLNPDQQVLEHIKSAAVSLKRAQQFTNDVNMIQVFNAITGVLNKTLLKFDGSQIMQSLQEAIASFPPPVAPGVAGGPQPGAPPQGGAPAPAAPQSPPPGIPGLGA